MTITLSVRNAFSFLLLVLVMLELHEMVHISAGRIICGCWGLRDFNVWSLCESCPSAETQGWIATLAGPVFSFAMMWLGWWIMRSDRSDKKALGFSLLFANIPFGRLTGVMMGGGDEMVVIKHFLKTSLTRFEMIVLASALVLMIVLPPIVKACQVLKNKFAWIYILAFLTIPLLFLLLYVLTAMNGILSRGTLATEFIMGTPILITLHTMLAAALLALMRKGLYFRPN